MGRVSRFKKLKKCDPFNTKPNSDNRRRKEEELGHEISFSKEDQVIPNRLKALLLAQQQMRERTQKKPEPNKQKGNNNNSPRNNTKNNTNNNNNNNNTNNNIPDKNKNRKKKNDKINENTNDNKNPSGPSKELQNIHKIEIEPMRSNETYDQFSRRVSRQTSKVLSKIGGIEVVSETKEKQKQHFKEKKEKEKEKKRKKLEEENEDQSRAENDNSERTLEVKEHIPFGEVADRPPQFIAVPKRRKTEQLALPILSNDANSNSITIATMRKKQIQHANEIRQNHNNNTADNNLSRKERKEVDEKRNFELLRESIIKSYRDLKKKKERGEGIPSTYHGITAL